MALWQFTFGLIPSSAVALDDLGKTHVSPDWLDSVSFDLGKVRTRALLDRIGMILPERRQPTEGLRVWGDYESDDVQVGVDRSDMLEYVQIRLDASNPSRSMMGRFCFLARNFGCNFIDDDGAVFRPDVEVLDAMVAQSDAARYVRDPAAYLRETYQGGAYDV